MGLSDEDRLCSFAKSVQHEPRNGINLCDLHHNDFDDYRFFIRWVLLVTVSIVKWWRSSTINRDTSLYLSTFPRMKTWNNFMGKRSYLMQTTTTARSLLHSWSRRCVQGDFILGALTDQSPVHDLARILLTTIVEVWEMEVILGSALVGVAAWAPGGSGRAVSSISEPPSTGIISCSQQSFPGSRTGRIHAPPVATAPRLEICNSRRIDLQGRGKRTPGNTSILLASLTSLKNSIIQVKS